MILTIETTHRPATDLGYLLHKNPARPQTFDTAFGTAHIFYPHASEDRCTAALLLEIDPVGLVRRGRAGGGSGGGEGFSLDQYVNDRPYVASSFLSVALNSVFRNALNGQSKERPELVARPIPLIARIAVVPSHHPDLISRLFQPLGYDVEVVTHPLDEAHPEWGDGRYHTVTLSHTITLQVLLQHLYVLIPVLDNDKHYWVGEDEIAKLLARGSDWLPRHPEKDLIARRYLKHQSRLTRDALARLAEEDESDPDAAATEHDAQEEAIERPLSLNRQRIGAVLATIKASGARSVLDLGCGEGQLLRELLTDKQFERIVGVDVSMRSLQRAAEKLRLDRLPDRQRARLTLLHGSLIYRDDRLAAPEPFDAAAIVEVIEHLDPPRLRSFERAVFEFARPRTVIVTTPNREYNVRWETLPAGKFRHHDHRFEWTRAEFQEWAERVAAEHGYTVQLLPVGPENAEVGPPTQMGVFERS